MKQIPHVFLMILIILLMLGLPAQLGFAQTQTDMPLDAVRITLLPEFIQPSVLVIYEITLHESLPLPQELVFQVPSNAQIITIINLTPEDRPIELPFQESHIGDWKNLRFSTETRHVRIEYRDPNLVRQRDQRAYQFEWLSIYSVNAFTVIARQPLGASLLESQPPMVERIDRNECMTDYFADFGLVPAGKLILLALTYKIEPAGLAYPALPVKAAMPFDESAAGRTASPIGIILWLVFAGTAVMIVVGLYYWWFKTNITDKHTRIIQGVGLINPEKQAVYCHECGMRARVGQSYCGNCGTQLRKLSQSQQARSPKPE